MTLPSPLARPAIAARIAAASTLHPILRRATARALHAELTQLPDTIGTAADWRALSRLHLACEIELLPRPHMVPPESGDIGQALEFGELSRAAHNRGVMMRVRCERDALRRTKRAPRVIDAVCVEVA